MNRLAATAVVWLSLLTPASAETAEPRVSTAGERRELSVTIYNQDFGLVRELRDVPLGRGPVQLEFRDVAASIQAETVHVRALEGDLEVLEQNYRFDLLSPEKLLEKYVGRSVRVYRWNEKTGHEEGVDAEVLAAGAHPVLRIEDEITFRYPGRLAFPEIPKNLIAKPTLVWLLRSERERQPLEVSYLANRLGWKADYVLVLSPDDTRGDLTGWVTLSNRSGAVFENATLKLVAGDVKRVVDRTRPQAATTQLRSLGYMEDGGFREEGLFEYHLYTLGRPTTLLDNETKQVTLLEAPDVGVRKRLLFQAEAPWFRSLRRRGEPLVQKVSVRLELENAARNGLGDPLPQGIVRVYKADSEGAQQFLGEDRIEHTPRDETLRLDVGEAFDVVAERDQTDYQILGKCSSESAWRIDLRNHKDEDVEVDVVEAVDGDWELVKSSHPVAQKSAKRFRYRVGVPKRGETRVEYRVRVRWC